MEELVEEESAHERGTRRARRTIATLVAGSLLLFGLAVAVPPVAHSASTTTSYEAVGNTPAERHGQLHVCDTNLCSENGQVVQLRGMSTHGLQWFEDCLTSSSLDVLANDWQADVMRISMYIQEGGYETEPRRFTDLVHSLINEADARGMYAIVDWHMLTPGDPHANLDQAITFFTEIASVHADKDNLLYEVANEPNGVGWPRIKDYHEQIIPVIRAQDPDSVILLGTRAWSSLGLSDGADESEIIDNPVNADNIMYTFHFYAASHRESYFNALARAADQIPMFVTEFGTEEFTGDGPNDFAMAQQYIDLMADEQISWTKWNFSDDFRSGAVFQTGTCSSGNFDDPNQLKESGQWARDQIRANR